MAGKPSSLRLIFGRIRRNPIAFLGLLIILGYVGMALFAPVLAPHDPIRQDLDKSFAPISAEHPLGCDEFGRDILSRILFGARISLTIQVFSVGIALFVGVFLGAISGFFGGWIDEGIMRIMDILLAFPGILLALDRKSTRLNSIGIYSIPQFARITRGSVLTVKQNEYVTAARAIGETKPSVILRYVLPNAISPIIIQTTLRMATVLLTAAGLGFLGLGVQPPQPEWGTMLSTARMYLRSAPMVAFFPGVSIMIVVLGFNFFGDGLQDALNPKLKD